MTADAKRTARAEPGLKKATPRPADRVDFVYDALKALAVSYGFKPRERVNEVELASRFGVSRTPIREALNRLVRDGFMSFVPNRGFYARDITPEGVHDLYELRAAIEVAAFRLACARASDEDVGAVAAIWEDAAGDGELLSDPERAAAVDEAFHIALARLSKNAQLVQTLESINSRIHFFRVIYLEGGGWREQAFAEHGGIIAGLRSRAVEEGIRIVEQHATMSLANAMEVTKEGLARIYLGADR